MKLDKQIAQMIDAGASVEEANRASYIFEILRPGLKIKRNGRIDTNSGDRTPLGLYRLLVENMKWDGKA